MTITRTRCRESGPWRSHCQVLRPPEQHSARSILTKG
ncbi:hypothetical protein Save01_07899 [Streptomyces avermitilis]